MKPDLTVSAEIFLGKGRFYEKIVLTVIVGVFFLALVVCVPCMIGFIRENAAEKNQSDGDRLPHFVYENHFYGETVQLEKTLPEGYQCIGTVTEVKKFTGKELEGYLVGGDVYMGSDLEFAYIYYEDNDQQGFKQYKKTPSDIIYVDGMWDYDYKIHLEDSVYRLDRSAESISELPEGCEYKGIPVMYDGDYSNWYVEMSEQPESASETVYLSEKEACVYRVLKHAYDGQEHYKRYNMVEES